MVTQCLYHMMKISHMYTDFIGIAERCRKNSRILQIYILKYLNRFISIVLDARDCPNIGSIIRNDDGRCGLNRLFRDEGLVDMPDGIYMKNLDNMFPLIWSFV